VETVQNLLIKLKSAPLLEWKKQVRNLNQLFYVNDEYLENPSAEFIDNATLVVMGKSLNCEHLLSLLAMLSEEGINRIRINPPIEVDDITVISLGLSHKTDALKEKMKAFCAELKIDFALIPLLPDWNKPGLVLMDMDSTTIQIECIDEIARLHGVGDQVSAVTALAMQGKLDFNQSLRTRVSKLKDAPVSILSAVADSMPLMPGLLVLIDSLKKSGWKVAIASGGFTFFADRLQQDHGFDAVVANTLEIKDNCLTGVVLGEIINADVKKRTLLELARAYDIPMSQTVAIGDGANDLMMMEAAALGIAIHAKPIVQEKAAVSINNIDLQGALGLLCSTNSANNWSS